MQVIMGSTTANSERRNSTRKRPPSLIYVELSAANGGMMRDLSEEGFALRAMMPLRVGDEIFFSFLLDPITRVEGQGEILWIEENGRVAGARFTEINSEARRQIRSWLNDELESQEAEKHAPPEADAQSFEMLREELRSAPPRPDPTKPKANKSKWPVARPGNVPSEGPSVTSRGVSEENPDDVPAATLAGAGKAEPAGNPADSYAFPGLPDFSVTQDGSDIAFEPLSTPEPVRDTLPLEQSARRSEVTAFPKRPDVQPPKGPMLPDISEILMQPPRRQGGYTSSPPMLEPLVPPYPRAAGRKGFSLSNALMIMVALAFIVGGFVYRDMVGQGLVWLGQQIGGSQGSTVPAPAPKDEAPVVEGNPPSSNTTPAASSSAPAPSSVAPESSQKETKAAEAAPDSTKPQPALPSLEKKPQPPVTPLSGISSSQGSDVGQEAGSAEYHQAMQLLHDGIATDSSEAVRLLWISVEKGNPSAELTLAELYWRGQGVARNCDQTGILLGAAARKGNVDAQKRLKQFRQEGCE